MERRLKIEFTFHIVLETERLASLMKLNKNQFLGFDPSDVSYQKSVVTVVPWRYEGGVSFGKGASQGPDAIIDASKFLELYDQDFDLEPCEIGIATLQTPVSIDDPKSMMEHVYRTTKQLLDDGKFVLSVGGDHSISIGCCKAYKEKFQTMSIIQFDAHADLRKIYENDLFSHACVMSRLRELYSNTMQFGIRSMSLEEAHRVKNEKLKLFSMRDMRKHNFDLEACIASLPDPVYVTFDVDAFDWSVIRSTGTPEPGGMLWDEALSALGEIFKYKKVVGFDLVELAPRENDINSAFAAAKLIYKVIGLKYFCW